MAEPKFLLMRYRAIGDCVMAAWAATSIRQRYPDAFLCWAVETVCAPVVDNNRLVSQRFEIPQDKWKRKRWSPQTWRDQIAKASRLRQMKFDYGADLQGHLKTALMLRIAKPKVRISAAATDEISRRLNPILEGRPDDLHTVEWNHRVISTFGEFQIPEVPIMPDHGRERDPRLATISVGAGHPTKIYPIDRWIEVGTKLREAGYRVAFVGGPKDPSPEVEGMESWVGKRSLVESIGDIAASGIHLAGDTGSGHIAAAVGTPVVSVFGPMPAPLYRPYTKQGTVLERNGDPSQISVDEIVSAALAYCDFR